MGGYGGIKNKVNELGGRYLGIKTSRKEKAERDALASQLNKFVVSSERALKGGVLGPRIIEMFKQQGIYPDIDVDTPETFQKKLHIIKDEIEGAYKAADYSLKYKVNIDPSDLHEFESYINPIAQPQEIESAETLNLPSQPMSDAITVRLINVKTGEEYLMPQEAAIRALETGEFQGAQ
jgi:formyltetrahydrofolate synthetase